MYQIIEVIGMPKRLYHKIWLIMRLTTVILIACLMQVSAAGLAQKITLNQRDVPLGNVLKEIRKQSGFDVFSEGKGLPKNQKVTVVVTNASIEEALDQAFKGLGYTYKIDGKTIAIKPMEQPSFFERIIERFQAIDVTGKIVDENGQPIAGATVKVKGTTISTASDGNGVFLLKNISDDAVLQISYLGYQPKEAKATTEFRTIRLEVEVGKLEEVSVVSTGYQTIPKERATGSFVFVDNALLSRRVSTNILERLEGIVPGILFNKNTSSSVNRPDISIRGRSTIFANAQPLIVVDGFPYDGDLSNINPNDIENISILKDAAAASIWGVRSGNGVIVLTTKSGKNSEKFGISFNSNVTIGEKPNVFDSRNYISSKDLISVEKELFEKQFYNTYLNDPAQVIFPSVQALNANKTGSLSTSALNGILDSLSLLDIRNDISKYYYRKALSQQYSLSLSSSGNKYAYRFSFGYDQNDFNLVRNNNKRTTLSLANTFYPFKNFEIQSNIYLVNVKADNNNTLSDLNVAGTKRSMYPYTTLIDDNGNPTTIERGYNRSFLNGISANGKYANWDYYPLNELNSADNTSRNLDNRIVLGLKYKFIEGLNFSANYQYENQILENNNYYDEQTYYARNLYNMYLDANKGITPVPKNGILDYTKTNLSSNRVRALLNYNSQIGIKGNLTALVGSEVNDVRTSGVSNTAYGFNKSIGSQINVDFSNYYATIPGGTARLIPNNNGFSGFTDRVISYFGNAGYTFDQKYILSLSGRIDKSNLFGVATNQKSVPLYSTGLAWDISKEDFYKSSWIPYLKLRVSYGYNGNVDKSTAAVTTIRQSNNSYYTGYPFATILNPNNPQLQWEKTKILNFGIDFASKSDFISGSIEYYKKEGINLIGNSPLPPSSGLTQFRGNTANSTGNGADIQLSLKPFRNEFSWTAVVNYSYTLDKVSKYLMRSTVGAYLNTDAGTIAPIEGKPLFSVFAYKWSGLDSDGNPQGVLNGKPSTNYTGIISGAAIDSLAFKGSARPTSFGSFINTFSYKSLSLSFNIMYKFGYYFRRSSINYNSLFYNSVGHIDFTKRWQNPGDELNTDIPSIQKLPFNTNRENFYQSSEVLVTKGDHIRLQDINLSYKLPLQKAWANVVKNAYIYFYAQDIGIIWKANKNNIDPDTFGNNLQTPKSYSLGVKCSF